MDIELLKTFIEVTRTRHFSRAADRLFLTPAAVSARIRLLEQTLGVSLLQRTRGNIQMTPEGERLLPHAQQLVAAWQAARAELSHSGDQPAPMRLGAGAELWQCELAPLPGALQRQWPERSLRIEAHSAPELWERILARQLDLIFSTEPSTQAELICTRLGQTRLLLASPQAQRSLKEGIADYLQVDWGAAFDQFQARKLPELRGRSGTNQGSLAPGLLKNWGGCAYLPSAWVNPDQGLYPVAGAPVFNRPLFACYRASSDPSVPLQAVLSLATSLILPEEAEA